MTYLLRNMNTLRLSKLTRKKCYLILNLGNGHKEKMAAFKQASISLLAISIPVFLHCVKTQHTEVPKMKSELL